MAIFTNQEKDIIKRTKANLDFIDKAKHENKGVYETTQLFNSLLGIIVYIKEKKINADNFKSIKLTDDKKEEWAIPKEIKDNNLWKFLYNLRNAVAHIDITFTSDNSGKIKTLSFKDSRRGGNWECTFTVDGMSKFINKLCEYIENN